MPNGQTYTYVSIVLNLPEEQGPTFAPRCHQQWNWNSTQLISHTHGQKKISSYSTEDDILPSSSWTFIQWQKATSDQCHPSTVTPTLYPAANNDSGQALPILQSMAEGNSFSHFLNLHPVTEYHSTPQLLVL